MAPAFGFDKGEPVDSLEEAKVHGWAGEDEREDSKGAGKNKAPGRQPEVITGGFSFLHCGLCC